MTTQTQYPLVSRLAEDEATLAALKKQRVDLDRQIADWEEMVRIERDIVSKRPRAEPPEPPKLQEKQPGGSEPHREVRHRSGSKTYNVYTAVAALLVGNRTMHRKVLYERLIQDGVIDHKTTLAHFSHLLSMAKGRFVSDGNGNWSLAKGGPS